MKGKVRAFLASSKSKVRKYAIYYGWNGHEIRVNGKLIYACHSYQEAEKMMLELEAAK